MHSNRPLLDALSATERTRLLDRAVARRLARGESLCLAGSQSRRAHLLTSGIVKMVARGSEGQTTIVCLAGSGEVLGEISALDGRPQPLDVIAATRCEVLGIDADLLLDVVRRNPEVALVIGRALARRFRWLSDAALERSTSTVPGRLAGRLLDLADLMGRRSEGAIEVDLPLAQDDLGRLSGMCRESACKALRSFKNEGLLDYRGRRVRILRPDALERIRCAGRSRA